MPQYTFFRRFFDADEPEEISEFTARESLKYIPTDYRLDLVQVLKSQASQLGRGAALFPVRTPWAYYWCEEKPGEE